MDYELMMNGNVKIGQKAPDFNAITTFGNISLKDYKGKWLIFFSHPGDFTPVKSASLDEYMKTPDIAHKFYSGQVTRIWNKNGLKSIVRRYSNVMLKIFLIKV